MSQPIGDTKNIPQSKSKLLMEVNRRIIKNTGFLTVAQGSGLILQVVYTVLIARYLGSSDFGMFFFVFAFVQLFYSFADLGVWTVMIRDLSHFKEERLMKYVNNTLALRLCMVILIYGVMVFVFSFLEYSPEVKYTAYVLAVGIGFSSVTQVFVASFRAMENMQYEGVGTIFRNVVYSVTGAALVVNGSGIVGLACANCLSHICYGIYIFIYFKRELLKDRKLNLEYDLEFWRYLIRNGLPLAFGTVLGLIESRLDIMILAFLRPPVEVGWYSAARRIVEIMRAFPESFYGSLLPVWSNYYKTDLPALQSLSVRVCKLMAFVALPIAVLVTLVPDRIILLLFGAEFLPADNALRVLIWLVFISYIGSAYGYLIFASHNSVAYARIMAVCTPMSLILLLLLIPYFGITGAAIAIIISHGLGAFLGHMVVSDRLFSLPIYEIVRKPLLSSAVMGLVVVLLVGHLNILTIVVVAAVSYLSSFFVVNGASFGEFDMVRKYVLKEES